MKSWVADSISSAPGSCAQANALLLYDDNTLNSSNLSGTVKLWKLVDGTCIHTLLGHTHCVGTLVVSDNGAFLATGARRGMFTGVLAVGE